MPLIKEMTEAQLRDEIAELEQRLPLEGFMMPDAHRLTALHKELRKRTRIRKFYQSTKPTP